MVKIYFAGARTKRDEQYIRDNNGKRLLSYYTEQSLVQQRVDAGLKTFLDSGAFTAHTKGADIDVDEYIEYINQRHEQLTCYAQLDTIPGEFGKPKTKEQLEEAPELTWENYLYMYERLEDPKKLLPIFHQGEDFKHLHRMLEHTPKVEYIGISPANDVSTPRKATWIDECFEIIKHSSNPDIKTHAFGMTSLRLLEEYPFYSADSTSWIAFGINGNILCDRGLVVVGEGRKKDKDHILHQPKQMIDHIKKEVESKGFNLDKLIKDSTERTMFNIQYFLDWENRERDTRKERIIQSKLF